MTLFDGLTLLLRSVAVLILGGAVVVLCAVVAWKVMRRVAILVVPAGVLVLLVWVWVKTP